MLIVLINNSDRLENNINLYDIHINMKVELEKNGDWLNKITKVRCKRCGHEWFIRKAERPRTCPKCRSVYWDVPRKMK